MSGLDSTVLEKAKGIKKVIEAINKHLKEKR
jgi:hypothetical protein